MASTYTTNLQLETVATGEKAGLWGTITNTNLEILEQASSGTPTYTIGATVSPDGSGVTVSTGAADVNVITWNAIDPDASQTWTNIDPL